MNGAQQTQQIHQQHQQHQQHEGIVIIRLRDVQAKTGLSRSTIYAQIANGNFPRQTPLSARAVGWVASEIETWLRTRVENRG